MDETAPAENGERLSRAERAILARTPDTLKGVLGGFFCPSQTHRDLEQAGLLKMDGYGSHGGAFVARYVITDKGREALRHDR